MQSSKLFYGEEFISLGLPALLWRFRNIYIVLVRIFESFVSLSFKGLHLGVISPAFIFDSPQLIFGFYHFLQHALMLLEASRMISSDMLQEHQFLWKEELAGIAAKLALNLGQVHAFIATRVKHVHLKVLLLYHRKALCTAGVIGSFHSIY